jgi:hypothetical protein
VAAGRTSKNLSVMSKSMLAVTLASSMQAYECKRVKFMKPLFRIYGDNLTIYLKI